jgi:hypothetical protein
MEIFGFRPKADIWTGLAISVGLLMAPVVIPMVAAAARPLIKAALKGGILVYERACEMVAEVTEVAEDLVEEVKSEVQTELAQGKD